MVIQTVETEDLPQILEVQHLAYQEQARLCNDFEIPPLMETLEVVRKAFPSLTILKAVNEEGVIVGSVRGWSEDDICHLGRLFVHPLHQGRGIGTALLSAMEAACPKPCYELFTSNLSIDNIRLYERMGYTRFREEPHPAGYQLVFMEKRPPADA